MAALLGPNTAASIDLLRPQVILCAGEDASELQRAFVTVNRSAVDSFFEYRCYRFWRMAEITVIWTGIGTGCLEPLLWEIISPGIIEKIVLIGSAGRLPNRRAPIGQPMCISSAYSGGTSLDGVFGGRPARPRFTTDIDEAPTSIVSTDFYYGFTSRSLDGSYTAGGEALRSAVGSLLHACDLVDMETAQFYHFCERFDLSGNLQYLAIKGACNEIATQIEQLHGSEQLMVKCFRRAWNLLSGSRGG